MLDPATLSMQWPAMAWLLAVLPLLAGISVWQSVRAKRGAERYVGLGVSSMAPTATNRVRRIFPQVLMFLGLAGLLFSITRPQAALMLPARIETIMLAVDSSGSMRAADMK